MELLNSVNWPTIVNIINLWRKYNFIKYKIFWLGMPKIDIALWMQCYVTILMIIFKCYSKFQSNMPINGIWSNLVTKQQNTAISVKRKSANLPHVVKLNKINEKISCHIFSTLRNLTMNICITNITCLYFFSYSTICIAIHLAMKVFSNGKY